MLNKFYAFLSDTGTLKVYQMELTDVRRTGREGKSSLLDCER